MRQVTKKNAHISVWLRQYLRLCTGIYMHDRKYNPVPEFMSQYVAVCCNISIIIRMNQDYL